MRFEGKVVIVTGAGSGIGAAAARRFSEEGAAVMFVGDHRKNVASVASELCPASAPRFAPPTSHAPARSRRQCRRRSWRGAASW